MKSLLACVGISAVVLSSAAAQLSVRNALGGPLASRTLGHPLGGIIPGANTGGRNFRGSPQRGPLVGYPFAYSVWVPDYFDYLSQASQYGNPQQYGSATDTAPPAPQQPVIINQYFSTPPAQQPDAPDPKNTTAQTAGDPIGSPQNYYLIAYKNHAVYSALAYWLEDKTLHYVTTENTHNQASLDLIDLTLTKSLNQRNEVPFSIPGQ
jgi:hypothetical protein